MERKFFQKDGEGYLTVAFSYFAVRSSDGVNVIPACFVDDDDYVIAGFNNKIVAAKFLLAIKDGLV
jgi:hypothetical protein